MVLPSMTSFHSEPLTENGAHSERCLNPFCKVEMQAKSGKKYCCDHCRMDGYVLRRAKAMMDEVGLIEFHERVDRAA
jgi:hypothetical protein